MGAIAAALIGGGTSLIGGYLQGQGEEDLANKQLASTERLAKLNTATGIRRSYPGQKSVAEMLSSYLSEGINTGLTEKEKQVYRGEQRTGVDQAIRSSKAGTSSSAASQGLRGGSIASILSNIEQQRIPAYSKIEGNIANMDMSEKKRKISEILSFLSLSAGLTDEDIEKLFSGFDLGGITSEDEFNDPLSQLTGQDMGMLDPGNFFGGREGGIDILGAVFPSLESEERNPIKRILDPFGLFG